MDDPGSIKAHFRFLNVEKFARECARQVNTITIIIYNACRTFPAKSINKMEEFIIDTSFFHSDTTHSDINMTEMPGLGVVICDALSG